MPREIDDGIFWIQECRDSSVEGTPGWYDSDQPVHSTRSAYLLTGEKSLLFDTLSPVGRDHVVESVADVLGGEPLDYLLPSHPENPHAGNTFAILDEFPEATLLAPRYGELHELYYLGDAVQVDTGDEIDLGGHVVEFVEPSFVDHFMHTWMYERTTDVLFCVDWFGFPHTAGECLTLASELDSAITRERLGHHPPRPFFWYEYCDVRKTSDTIDWLIGRYGESVLAPTHGLVIDRDQPRYMEMMKDVVVASAEAGDG